MIQSPCSIKFTPSGGAAVELVAIGDDLVSLPRFEPTAQIFELDGVESPEAYFQPLGGVVVVITVETAQPAPEPHFPFLNAEILDDTEIFGVTGSLEISSEAGTATYAPAVMKVRPGLPWEPDPVVSRYFTITAALPEIE